MKEINGDILNFHSKGEWICITTNGIVNKSGKSIMGAGIALQANIRFPDLPIELGEKIQQVGNIVHIFEKYKIISFPTKNNWWENSDIKLIEDSAKFLSQYWFGNKNIYLPRVGCGNGKLIWNDVKLILEKYFDDRFIVVNR